MKAKLVAIIMVAILSISGCRATQRPRRLANRSFWLREPRVETRVETKQKRIRKWEALAYQLKRRHPEWKQSIKELAAELEYQWMLIRKKK